MIRVDLPEITLHLLFSVSNDLWMYMFRAGVVLFLFNFLFFFLLFLIVLKHFLSTVFCELVIRVEKQIT